MSFDHRLDIYGVDLHLATTLPQVRGLHKRYTELSSGFDGGAIGQTCSFVEDGSPVNRFHVAIWIDVQALVDNGDEARAVTTIAHEATHVAGMICRHQGVKQNGWHEHYAYLIGWLTGWIWKEAIR